MARQFFGDSGMNIIGTRIKISVFLILPVSVFTSLSVIFLFNFRSLSVCTATFMFSAKEDNCLKLVRKHAYYDQIQGQLHLTSTACCDLLIWTTVDCQIIRIAVDRDWLGNISKLLEFYFTQFIPSLD